MADLDSPPRELSNGVLGIVVTLLVRWQINFSSARIGRPIQLQGQNGMSGEHDRVGQAATRGGMEGQGGTGQAAGKDDQGDITSETSELHCSAATGPLLGSSVDSCNTPPRKHYSKRNKNSMHKHKKSIYFILLVVCTLDVFMECPSWCQAGTIVLESLSKGYTEMMCRLIHLAILLFLPNFLTLLSLLGLLLDVGFTYFTPKK